jgi:hypothetical protein
MIGSSANLRNVRVDYTTTAINIIAACLNPANIVAHTISSPQQPTSQGMTRQSTTQPE